MAERVKEKAQAKKAGVASITKLRKQRQRDGFAGELDLDAELAGPGRKPAMKPGQRIRPGELWCSIIHRSLPGWTCAQFTVLDLPGCLMQSWAEPLFA